MPMTKMTIKTTGAALLKIFVDHSALSLTDGLGHVDLSSGEYVLTWVALGAPTQEYSIEISSPSTATWKTSAVLDLSGKDAGLHWVEI